MPRLTPTDIVSQYSAISALNANFDAIATLIELCLFRDGTSPNQMLAALNMNNFKIQNLADGTATTDAVNVGQLADAALGDITGDLDLSGTLDVSGDVTLGTDSSNVVAVNAGTFYVTNPTTTVQLALEPVAGTTSVLYLKGVGADISKGLTIQGGSDTGIYRATAHIFRNPASSDTFASITTGGIDLGAGNVLSVNSQQVVGARGAALPADATDLASVIALANAIKARLKATGGHGLVAD